MPAASKKLELTAARTYLVAEKSAKIVLPATNTDLPHYPSAQSFWIAGRAC